MDLRYSTAIAQTGICNIAPPAGDLGIGVGARIVSPIGTKVIDANGVALLQQWIGGMGAHCQ